MPRIGNAIVSRYWNEVFMNFGEEATYKVLTSETRNTKTGAVSKNYTATGITVLSGEVGQDLVERSKGRFRVGDSVFRLRRSEITNEPDTTVRVVYLTEEYNVIGWVRSQDHLIRDLVCRPLDQDGTP